MKRMFIFNNYEDVGKIIGYIRVQFTETEEGLQDALYDRDLALAMGIFKGDIPTAHLVEMYVKRAELEGPGDHGNDWVFENAWVPYVSRKEAFQLKYGKDV